MEERERKGPRDADDKKEGFVIVIFGRPICAAPEWHRCVDALAGSIPRTDWVITTYGVIGPNAKPMADRFISLVHELATEACPVNIRVEGQ